MQPFLKGVYGLEGHSLSGLHVIIAIQTLLKPFNYVRLDNLLWFGQRLKASYEARTFPNLWVGYSASSFFRGEGSGELRVQDVGLQPSATRVNTWPLFSQLSLSLALSLSLSRALSLSPHDFNAVQRGNRAAPKAAYIFVGLKCGLKGSVCRGTSLIRNGLSPQTCCSAGACGEPLPRRALFLQREREIFLLTTYWSESTGPSR